MGAVNSCYLIVGLGHGYSCYQHSCMRRVVVLTITRHRTDPSCGVSAIITHEPEDDDTEAYVALRLRPDLILRICYT
jgi:hypothetical protein